MPKYVLILVIFGTVIINQVQCVTDVCKVVFGSANLSNYGNFFTMFVFVAISPGGMGMTFLCNDLSCFKYAGDTLGLEYVYGIN